MENIIDLDYVSSSISSIKEKIKDKSVNDDFTETHKNIQNLKAQVVASTCAYFFIMSFIIDSLEVLDKMITSYHKDRKCTMPELCDFCDHINNVIAMSLKII